MSGDPRALAEKVRNTLPVEMTIDPGGAAVPRQVKMLDPEEVDRVACAYIDLLEYIDGAIEAHHVGTARLRKERDAALAEVKRLREARGHE